MRSCKWAGAVVAALAVAVPVWAQVVTFGGVNPVVVQNRPVTTPDVVSQRPIAQPQTRQQNRFRLSDYLPRIVLPSNNPVHGQSVFPTPENLPNKNYLKAFGYQVPRGIDP
jgi:hypothetical protein